MRMRCEVLLLAALLCAVHAHMILAQADRIAGRQLQQLISSAPAAAPAAKRPSVTVTFENIDCVGGFPTYYSVDEGSFDISLFRTLLMKNKLDAYVIGNTTGATMFAPTNTALYSRLSMLGIDLEKTQSSPELQDLLMQHLITVPDQWVQFADMQRIKTQTSAMRLPASVCKAANGTLTMQQTQDKGPRAQMVMESSGNSARIMPAHDILVCGKVIHIVDDVLLPCCQPSIDSVQNLPSMQASFTSLDKDVQLFYDILQAQIQATKAQTIFMPTSDALQKQLYSIKGLSQGMDETQKNAAFKALAQYHIIPSMVTVTNMAKISLYNSLSYTSETVLSIGRDPLQLPNCIGTVQLKVQNIAPVGYRIEANAKRPLRYTTLANDTLQVVAEKSKANVVAYWKICDGSIVYIVDNVLSPCMLFVPISPPPPADPSGDYGSLTLSEAPPTVFNTACRSSVSSVIVLIAAALLVLVQL